MVCKKIVTQKGIKNISNLSKKRRSNGEAVKRRIGLCTLDPCGPHNVLPVTSFSVTPFPVMSFPISSFPVTSFSVTPCPVTSFPVTLLPVTSFPVMPFSVTLPPYRNITLLVTSSPAKPPRILPTDSLRPAPSLGDSEIEGLSSLLMYIYIVHSHFLKRF